MDRNDEAQVRAAAMIYFARRMISNEETLLMSMGEIIALYSICVRRQLF